MVDADCGDFFDLLTEQIALDQISDVWLSRPSEHVTEVDGKVVVNLEYLRQFISWDSHYAPKLGDLSTFLQDRGYRVVPVGEKDDQGLGFRTKSGALQGDTPRSPVVLVEALNAEGAQASRDRTDQLPLYESAKRQLTEILMRQTQSVPIFSMLNSLAAIKLQWATIYKPSLGKLGDWLYEVSLEDDAIIILHTFLSPEFNFVEIRRTKPAEEEAVGNHDDRKARSKPILGVGGGRMLATRVREPNGPAGVVPKNYFNIPLNIESSIFERDVLKGINRMREDIMVLFESGHLSECFRYSEGRFEVLEFLGDGLLHQELSRYIVHTYSTFCSEASLTQLRQDAEQRLTLALIYDELNLSDLMVKPPPNWGNRASELWKCKGDIIEAMVGELSSRLDDASAQGIPHGHRLRSHVVTLLRKVAEYLLIRGRQLKDIAERQEITAAASSHGGGGFAISPADAAASARYTIAADTQPRISAQKDDVRVLSNTERMKESILHVFDAEFSSWGHRKLQRCIVREERALCFLRNKNSIRQG